MFMMTTATAMLIFMTAMMMIDNYTMAMKIRKMTMMMIENDAMAGGSVPENPFLQTPIIPVVTASG